MSSAVVQVSSSDGMTPSLCGEKMKASRDLEVDVVVVEVGTRLRALAMTFSLPFLYLKVAPYLSRRMHQRRTRWVLNLVR